MVAEADEHGTMRFVRCASCGDMNPASATKCGRCGKSLHETSSGSGPRPKLTPVGPTAYCAKCEKSFPPGSKFCGFCGLPLPATGAAASSLTPARPAPPDVLVSPPASPQRVPFAARSATQLASDSDALPGVEKRTPLAPSPRLSPEETATLHKAGPLQVVPGAVPAAAPAEALDWSSQTSEATVVLTGSIPVVQIQASILERKPDGCFGTAIQVTREMVIGREGCDLSYAGDALLSPRHASVHIREGKLILKDLGSPNGTFIRQRQDTQLLPGDVFVLGRELFRFSIQNLDNSAARSAANTTASSSRLPRIHKGPVSARLEHIKLNGEIIEAFNLEERETTLGRTNGDLIFKSDPYMSGTHARIIAQPGRFVLQDLRSRNGVYRRIREEVELKDGDEFFVGEQLFQTQVKTVE